MTKASDTPDDFEAVRAVVKALEDFEREDQQRILRWAQEKLGITSAPVAAYMSPAAQGGVTPVPSGAASAAEAAAAPVATDIRSFIARKKPSSDNQLATAIAYWHRFEAPPAARKDAIKSEDLKEGARAIGQGGRFARPAQTLVNAHQQGLLDRAAEGGYTLSNVGENLVAVTMGTDGSAAGGVAPRKKVRARGGAAKKGKKTIKKTRR